MEHAAPLLRSPLEAVYPAAMASGLLLALALAAPAAQARQTPAECQAAYKDAYLEQWELKRDDWDAGCALGHESPEVTKAGQLAFQRECSKEFASAKNLAPGMAESYCAQGVAGRRRLKAQLGMPAEGLPASAITGAPEPPRAKPGDSGMGPLPMAVEAAKGRWGNEACLNAMVYFFQESRFNVERGEGGKSNLQPYTGQVESYYYYFAVPGKSKASPVVAFFDNIDPAFCIIHERLKGPEFDEAVKATGSDCLTKVEVPAPQALKVAGEGKLDLSGRAGLTAYLLSPASWGVLYGNCERGLRMGLTRWCKKALTKRQLRSLARKDLWIVDAEGKQAFIDAAEPKLLFVSDADIDLIHYQETGGGLMSTSSCPR